MLCISIRLSSHHKVKHFLRAEQSLLNKIQAIETEAIKIAYSIAPWTSNYWCYSLVNFTPILERIQNLAKNFLHTNTKDKLIGELINNSKASSNGIHSPIYKALNW